jgi:outer membrane protein OmpA-like peptidoglycan-associated protein
VDMPRLDSSPSTRWAIASVTSKGALGISESIFDLVNLHTCRAHRVKVLAGGFGKGMFLFSYSPDSSMSNYTYFCTREPVTFDDFDGVGAEIVGGSALFYSWSELTLYPGGLPIFSREYPFNERALMRARMSGWGISTPNISVDHGFTMVDYGGGDPLGVPETLPEINMAPAPEDLNAQVKIAAKDDSFVVILSGDVLFDFDKAEVKREGEILLTQAAAITRSARRKNSQVLIDGFTDNVGNHAYNADLSLRRARSTANWLIARKYLPASIIRTQGLGDSHPIAPNSDPAGRAKNRRVEMYVVNP